MPELARFKLSTLGLSLFILLSSLAFFLFVPGAEAANTISTSQYLDTNSNGTVETIRWTMDENVTACAYEAGDWTVNTASEINVVITALTCTGSDAILNITITADAGETGTATPPVISYANAGTAGSVALTSGAMSAKASVTAADAAAPRLLSQSPTSGAGSVSRNTSVVMVFTESINPATDSIAISPTLTTTDTWSVSNTTFTMVPATQFASGTYTVTVTTATDIATTPVTFGGAISGTTVHPWSFTTSSSSSNTGSTNVATPVAKTITITQPSVVEQLLAGERLLVEWDWTGDISNVNLSYSVDGGATYSTIVRNSSNDGRHEWILPAVDSYDVYLKIEGTDMATVLATDISTQFQITTGTEDAVEEPETNEPADDDEADVVEDEDDGMGISPVTGELEAITDVNVGDFIKSAYYDTVYWVDEDMVRRPFMDVQTFFTYADSFDVITEVTDATLPTLAIGSPMLPNARVVLVKIQSDERVYAMEADVDGSVALRWIVSEAVAIDNYGANWSDYVVDVDVTLFAGFESGDDVEVNIGVDRDVMKTRAELAALAQ